MMPDKHEQELIGQFQSAIRSLPEVATKVLSGQQFTCYERADRGDDDLWFILACGPISSFRHIAEVHGRARADLLESALKLATHVALREQRDSAGIRP